MQAAPAPISRRLPGASVTREPTSMALFCGAVAVMLVAVVLLIGPTESTTQRWHLPWPALQWAVATPLGNLSLLLLCLLVLGPLHVQSGVERDRRLVASAHDVTDRPREAWKLHRRRVPPQPPQRLGWWGVGRRERVVSLALLVLGVLLVVALAGAAWVSLVAVFRGPDLRGLCSARYGCPPVSRSLEGLLGIIAFATWTLQYGAQTIWLKRLEATSGVRFRYPDWGLTRPPCYLRQLGVTHEAAAIALARVSSVPSIPRPRARQLFSSALVASLYLAPVCAIAILYAWLPSQWLPG
jgi:hypothetical protein